jgi:pimeloyl-ACP methyl ester carboxylesterase
VPLPGRGEVFVRDTGGSGQPILLVHGWMFPSDLNWLQSYGPLSAAGYRVLAMDLRGHGKGLRSPERFRLADCADDAAALLSELGAAPALVVGYSMGGPVTELLAQRHPDAVSGFVLCATALDWQDAKQKLFWRTMAALRAALGVFPLGFWRAMIRLSGGDRRDSAWVTAELSRGSARDMAEAGRELGRFDSSGWVGALPQPAAVVLTARDRLVPPRKQRALADALGVEPHVIEADHDACAREAAAFNRVLLEALAAVRKREARSA